jgi:hypothetical protein
MITIISSAIILQTVRTDETKKLEDYFQSKDHYFSSTYLIMKLCCKIIIVLKIYKYTIHSINTIFLEGGNSFLITGKKATKASMIVMIEAILSPRALLWKNTPKLIKLISVRGRKTIIKEM